MTKSIDSAIMLQRTTDYVRDNSAQIKKSELMQEAASRVNHQKTEQEMLFVTDIENAREKTIIKDQEKKRERDQQPQKNSKSKSESDELDVGHSNEVIHIDIQI